MCVLYIRIINPFVVDYAYPITEFEFEFRI